MTEEEKELFANYEESKGGLQLYASQVDLYWYLYVSSYYGYRKEPRTEWQEFHRGLDTHPHDDWLR